MTALSARPALAAPDDDRLWRAIALQLRLSAAVIGAWAVAALVAGILRVDGSSGAAWGVAAFGLALAAVAMWRVHDPIVVGRPVMRAIGAAAWILLLLTPITLSLAGFAVLYALSAVSADR